MKKTCFTFISYIALLFFLCLESVEMYSRVLESAQNNTYIITVNVSGNGYVAYSYTDPDSYSPYIDNELYIGKSESFIVYEGMNVELSLRPNKNPGKGYRTKRILVNHKDVTSTIAFSYTISNIKENTLIEVEFEPIPQDAPSYKVSVKSKNCTVTSYNSLAWGGGGCTAYEGQPVCVVFQPTNGYKFKSLKVNNIDVSSSVTTNEYNVKCIKQDMNLDVEYEESTRKHLVQIETQGSGEVSFSSYKRKSTIRGYRTFEFYEGENENLFILPDKGYSLLSLTVNNVNVKPDVSGNVYFISNIKSDTQIKAVFEATKSTSFTIAAKGSGSVSYGGYTISNEEHTFTVKQESFAKIGCSATNGSCIRSIKSNGNIRNFGETENLTGTELFVPSFNSEMVLEVEFETIPLTYFDLIIKSAGNGSVLYDGTTVTNGSQSFSLVEGSSATITFSPNNGYRIKSVKVEGADVTADVTDNRYTISNIKANTTVEAEFEAIPPTIYTLSIKANGSGYASYNSTTVRNTTETFKVNEGTSATIYFWPDTENRIKSLTVNGTVHDNYSSFFYTFDNIEENATVEVEFEAIPPTFYDLVIKATGNGSITFDGTTITNGSRTFSVLEGSSATIMFSPDDGYRIKSVKVGGSDVTADVTDNRYTISSIKANTTLEAEFEAIPIVTYTLTITANGNGAVSYNGNTIRSKSETFTVNEGTTATIEFKPDNGYYTKSVKVNGAEVTESVVDDKYTISNIAANTDIEAEFAEELKAFASEGVNYIVTSFKGKTIVVTKGDYGKVVTVPATVNYQDTDWTVVGIEADALSDNSQLAAVIWNANAPFTATTSNPNLLLYVTDSSYAPSTVNNVVVNGTAESIILTEAASGNNFYCPQEFTARNISYAHNYTMTTGIGEARGWETLALPFDVQQVKHENKGELTPFANWKSGNEEKPFWLMELSNSGWRETDRIMANTPYIVSMPNNEKYKEEFLLNGKVTFSAENATVRKSEDVKTVQYEGRTFIPTFSEIGEGDGAYALNVSNDYETNVSGVADGSRFVLNLRSIHPFEAYMQSSAKTRAFDISDGMGIVTNKEKLMIKVYNLKGQMLKHQEGTEEDIKKHLPKGLYIINGKKIIVR